MASDTRYLSVDAIYLGKAERLLPNVTPDSVACSIWSPPYHVGKEYEQGCSYDSWTSLLRTVIGLHTRLLKPGGFLVINIADILCFPDRTMPKLMATNVTRRKSSVTKEEILKAWAEHPEYNRYRIAGLLGCSEQTVDRRLKGNNVRGGKYNTQTKVKVVGGLIEDFGQQAGLYLYDRRVWVKDPAWENSRWHTMSYRSIDEFEYLYVLWKPGVTVVDRNRLSKEEWIEWGARAVWHISSVRANNDHEAKFPLELPRRVIRLFSDPGDIILDCFMGSGTTAMAAIAERRRYIGIEKEVKYVERSRNAARLASRQMRLELREESEHYGFTT